MQHSAIYPGTFDPVTRGHEDLVARASKIFSRVIVAIAVSARKSPYFEIEDRLAMAQVAFDQYDNVEVCVFDGLLIDFALEKKADIILRGLRAVSDFDYEFQLAGMNRRMAPEIDTIFMPAAEDVTYLSSTMVREILALGGDVSLFVGKPVLHYLRKFLNGGER